MRLRQATDLHVDLARGMTAVVTRQQYVLTIFLERSRAQDSVVRERPNMKWDKLTEQQDSAALEALDARERIEAAVNTGELPAWVMDVCAVLESASMTYGAASERIKLRTHPSTMLPESSSIH